MIKKINKIIKGYRELQQIVAQNTAEIASLKDTLNDKDAQINNLMTHISNIENSVMKTFYIFEYKYWENKMLTNRLLYDEYLKRREKYYDQDFKPLVSIIIPVYNGSNYLQYAIDSALNQTYKNIEIIVVNDGSNDNNETRKIAKSYGAKIKYIEKENGGVSSALNTGIKNMKGDYFAWLSHDDLYYKNHIEVNIEYLRHCNNKNIIPFTCFDFIDSEGKVKMHDTVSAGIHVYDYKLTLYTHYSCILRGEVNGGNVLIPKEAFAECGYFEEGNRITQEKDMWNRLLKKYTFINIPIITYSIRSHNEQVSNTSGNTLIQTKDKIIDIINNMTDEEMIKESGSVDKFYLDLYTHYSNNSLNDLADEMLKRYNNCIKKRINNPLFYCVNTPFGVSIINKIFSSSPVFSIYINQKV